jgi:hypothetical protein
LPAARAGSRYSLGRATLSLLDGVLVTGDLIRDAFGTLTLIVSSRASRRRC